MRGQLKIRNGAILDGTIGVLKLEQYVPHENMVDSVTAGGGGVGPIPPAIDPVCAQTTLASLKRVQQAQHDR